MPVPGCGLKPKMVIEGEVRGKCSPEADQEESSANDYVEAVEPCGNKEGWPIYPIGHSKGGLYVFYGLQPREVQAEAHGYG